MSKKFGEDVEKVWYEKREEKEVVAEIVELLVKKTDNPSEAIGVLEHAESIVECIRDELEGTEPGDSKGAISNFKDAVAECL